VAVPVIVGLVSASGRWRDCAAKADPTGDPTVSTPTHSASSTVERRLGLAALITGAVVRDAGKSTNLEPSSPAMTPRRQDVQATISASAHRIPLVVPAVRSTLNASGPSVHC
jgi:hypothetical protein